ncbi:MAG: hypothetical protein ABIS92_01350 [Polyangia bacterium]
MPMTPFARGCRWSISAVAPVTLMLAVAVALTACADPAGTLLIVQNQIPAVDDKGGVCTFSTELSDPSLAYGIFDVDLDRPYPYFLYPLIENRFPSVQTGGFERNSLLLRRVNVSIKAPAGVDPGWAAGCPGSFSSPASGQMDPGSTRAVRIQGFQGCHAQRLRQLIVDGAIPGDLNQPVFFTLQLTAVADRSGSEQSSAVFPFDVQVCAGCLQSMFPSTPSCADAPKPNPLHGNPCNIAQEGPEVLCCTDPGGALICPAPDN